MERINCGLCGTTVKPLPNTGAEVFNKCPSCLLIQKHPDIYLDPIGEKKHYKTHNNDPEDERYVNFLSQAVHPVLPYLKKGMQALDYGCGPGPAINFILGFHHISCDNYDPIFSADGIKCNAYDAIFSTECFEHFYNPISDLKKIVGILKPGGYISVMTTLYENEDQFPDWYYARDPTHVSFFHLETMNWVQSAFNLERIYSDDKKVVVMRKL